MFSKSRIKEPGPKAVPAEDPKPRLGADPVPGFRPSPEPSAAPVGTHASKAKPAASVLSGDLSVTGNLKTTGDIVVEGVIDGDIRAHLLTVGETATIRGEIVADDIVINGRVIGRVRGLKVRLTSSARVEGDIIHKTIAIESGAHFEGSVHRQDDPLGEATYRSAAGTQRPAKVAEPAEAAPARKPAPQPEAHRSSAAVTAATEARKSAAPAGGTEKPRSDAGSK